MWISSSIHEYSSKFIAGMLTMGKKHGFSFVTPPEYVNRIQPHSLTIRSLFNDNKLIPKLRTILQRKNLLYIEQLLTIDGTHLLLWADLRHTTFSQGFHSSVVPKWYKSLEQQLLLWPNFSREVKPEFRFASSHFKGFSPRLFLNKPFNERHNNFIAIWSPCLQDSIMGKVINYLPNTDQLLIKHWIPLQSTGSTSSTLTPTKIRPCSGCFLADYEDPEVPHEAYYNTCYITLPACSAIDVDFNRFKSTPTTKTLLFSFFISISISNFHHFVSLDNSLYRLPSTVTRSNFNSPIEKFLQHGPSFNTLSSYSVCSPNLFNFNFIPMVLIQPIHIMTSPWVSHGFKLIHCHLV
jgi:hypothetical protein